MRNPAFEMVVAAVIVREKLLHKPGEIARRSGAALVNEVFTRNAVFPPDVGKVAGNNAIRHRGGDTPGAGHRAQGIRPVNPRGDGGGHHVEKAAENRRPRAQTAIQRGLQGNVAHAVRRVHHRRGFIRHFLNAKQRHHVAVIAGGKLVIKIAAGNISDLRRRLAGQAETYVVVHH